MPLGSLPTTQCTYALIGSNAVGDQTRGAALPERWPAEIFLVGKPNPCDEVKNIFSHFYHAVENKREHDRNWPADEEDISWSAWSAGTPSNLVSSPFPPIIMPVAAAVGSRKVHLRPSFFFSFLFEK